MADSVSRVTKKDYYLIKKSNLFKKDWYLSQYPDVSQLNIDPISHYIKYGGMLGRKPSEAFDVEFYKNQVGRDIIKSKNPLLHYLKVGFYKGLKVNPNLSTDVENDIKSRIVPHLWGAHEKKAEQELETILNGSSFYLRERVFAGWHLARWYHFNERYNLALDVASYIQSIDENSSSQKRFVMLRAFCNIHLGLIDVAKSDLKNYLTKKPFDSDALLAISNINSKSDHDKLDYINQVFKNNNLLPVHKIYENETLSLHNITGAQAINLDREQSLVSVIMPIFNAEQNIDTAIRGLLEQTWRNLEIIAVDDVSTDNTVEKIQYWVDRDSRVKLVRQENNGGAYAARNAGLKLARGEYITTHDSDDWSHPQKIQVQMEYLEKSENSSVKGVLTHWVRTKDNLKFTQNWRLNSELIHWSHSSFLFRKEVIEVLGEWDTVLIGGDTEFIWRVEKIFGSWSVKKLHKSIPFSFALDEETSLTRTKSTHVKTIHFGLRHMYREACKWWHNLNARDEPYLEHSSHDNRSFPVPNRMVSRVNNTISCDELIAGDFSEESDCVMLELYLKNKVEIGKGMVAVFHWPNYFKKIESISSLFFTLVVRYNLKIIVVGESVDAKSYMLLNNSLLKCSLDNHPVFENFQSWGLVDKSF